MYLFLSFLYNFRYWHFHFLNSLKAILKATRGNRTKLNRMPGRRLRGDCLVTYASKERRRSYIMSRIRHVYTYGCGSLYLVYFLSLHSFLSACRAIQYKHNISYNRGAHSNRYNSTNRRIVRTLFLFFGGRIVIIYSWMHCLFKQYFYIHPTKILL